MTENEAIEEVKFNMSRIGLNENTAKRVTEARDIAIQALEEIQQYKAIGKVEEVEYLVDSYNGMIRDFGDDMRALEQYRAIGLTPELIEAMQGHNVALINDLGEYQAIGTVEEFKALKEKNVAKKPIIHGLGQRYCPVCKCGGADHFYCARCGQKLG